MAYHKAVLNIVGFDKIIPIVIGIFIGKNPHILNGLKTNSPISLVDEFINSIPLRIYLFSFSVIKIIPSSV